jgi:NAD+ kinase
MKINRIIILYKRSAYSIYFQHPGSSFQRHGNVGADEIRRFRKMHEIHYASLKAVEEAVKARGIAFKKVCRGRRFDIEPNDFLVTVGGDGTFLEAARAIKNQIILGVNSDPSWSVGRFCFANARTFPAILQNLLIGKQAVRQFPRLALRVAGKRFNVLNDILFSHRNPAAMSRYSLTVGNLQEGQKSSGVWISTAAGSSGAIKSAGGKKFVPTEKIIQYRPRELYTIKGQPYRLKGGVLDASGRIHIESIMREGCVFVDGSHVSVPVGFGETVKISLSSFPLNMVGEK